MTLHTKRLFILVPLILVLMVVAFYHLYPAQVGVPTLVTWGGKDRVLHVSGAKILESLTPRTLSPN